MSDPEFFVLVNDETTGPFSASQLRQMIRNKEIAPETLGAKVGAKEWTPVTSLVNHAIGRYEAVPASQLSYGPRPAGRQTSPITWMIALIAVVGLIILVALVPPMILIAELVVGLFVYFLPAFIAVKSEHRNALAISVLNLLLGWTFLGWVISLVWALTKEKQGKP